MRFSFRIRLLLIPLILFTLVGIRAGDQYGPPPPNIPFPDLPFPNDPPDPFDDPFNPINDLPLPFDIPFPPDDPFDDLPDPFDFPPPDIDDPFPDLPSLVPDPFDDIPDIPFDLPPFPPGNSPDTAALDTPRATAANYVAKLMPFPRRILFHPAIVTYSGPRPTTRGACDPSNQTVILIAEHKRNTVAFINTCPPAIATRVTVGTHPAAVKATLDGQSALVANTDDGTVSVVNLASRTVTRTISVPLVNNQMMQPNAIVMAPDGTRAYIASHVDLPGSFVFILDLATMSFTGSIPVGGFPAGMAITPDGTQLWVSSRIGNRVDVFDTLTSQSIAGFGVLQATGVAINPTGTRAYMAAGISPGNVTVVDTSTLSIVATIPVGNLPHIIAITPTGNDIFVTNGLSNSISRINAATNKVRATYPVPGNRIHPLGLAFVNSPSSIK
jgi:YVTN family beta-propeller protein